jgi:hypothetical protein
MVINSNGTVGIGTTNPATKLHLLGVGTGTGPKLRFETLNNGNDNYTVGGTEIGGIQFGADDFGWSTQHMSSEIVGIHDTPNYSGARGILVFKTSTDQGSNPTEKMRINHDGKVGIGTNDPAQVLDVRGGNIRVDGTGERIIENKNDSSDFGTLTLASGYRGGSNRPKIQIHGYKGQGSVFYDNIIEFHTAGYSRMKITQNGRVGIGVAEPGDGLHVNNGNLRFGNNTYYQNRVVYANSSAGGTVYFEFGQTWIGDDSHQLLIITAGGNPAFNLGNFGMIASQHKSYGTGINQSIIKNFARQGSWTIGVSNSPNTGTGTYIYANGVNASTAYKCRMIILNITA